jgi:(heptosyl)LPS beta-1,4-glucosyltransferase
MNEISAIIVIKNSPPYLDQSIAAIDSFVDEIIIGTIDVPESLLSRLKKNKKIQIFPLDSSIPFADLVKEKLKKKAKGEYILYVDPDEIFPQKALDQLRKNMNKFDHFIIPRKNIIFGKWVQHSRWWPDYQLRFFKKDSVIWPETIHPIPQRTGRGFTIPATEELAIKHFNYDNLSQYFEKSLRYAKAEAKKAVLENKTITIGETFKKGLNEFISRYFTGEGYRDGSHGLVLALLQMFYYILVYVFYWEEMKYVDLDKETTPQEVQKFYSNGLRDTNYWLINKKLLYNNNKLKIKFLSKIINIFHL